MNISANPIVHGISLMLSSGALITAMSAANEIENTGLTNKTEVKQVKEEIRKQEIQLNEIDHRQREMKDILIRIETKVEDR